MPRTRNISVGVPPELHAMYAGLGLPERRQLLEEIRSLLNSRLLCRSPVQSEAGAGDGGAGRSAEGRSDVVQVSDLDGLHPDSVAAAPVPLPLGW